MSRNKMMSLLIDRLITKLQEVQEDHSTYCTSLIVYANHLSQRGLNVTGRRLYEHLGVVAPYLSNRVCTINM